MSSEQDQYLSFVRIDGCFLNCVLILADLVNYALTFLLLPTQAKALAEKNQRDLQAQREQAERHVRTLFQLIQFPMSVHIPSWN